MFEKSSFKTESFDILPCVQNFFKQPTDQRQLDHIDEIQRCLADIKPFSRLPKLLQDKFLQEASYECYPQNQVILQQGEPSTRLCVILSGTALVSYTRIVDGHCEILDILERGCTCGEKGLLTNGLQLFTITSKTKVELLVLWKQSFQSIYMTNDRQCTKDDLKFLKTHVSFLRGFPIDRLNEFPHAIQHCSFSAMEVVAKDSRRMKHIFVVKKGSMAVWKRLDPDGKTQKLDKDDYEPMDNEKMLDTSGGDGEGEATGDNNTLFSEVQLSGDIDDPIGQGTSLDTDYRLSRLHRSTTIDRRTSMAVSMRAKRVAEIEKKFPGIGDKRDRLPLIDYDQISFQQSTTPKLSIVNRPIINPKSKMILPNKMVYVHVKTLNAGQYFGLTDMLFPNQPALTLVSNECECLLLLKSSFVRIGSDHYKQNIRRTEVPFPSDSVFYKSYHQIQVWQRYSKAVYAEAWQRIRHRRSKHI